MIDLALKGLEQKDKSTLRENELKALNIQRDILKPFQKNYKEALKQIMQSFIFTVKKAIMDTAPVSLFKDEAQFKGLVILDNGK